MLKLVIALLTLCCTTQAPCSTKQFMEAPYTAEYTEYISPIVQSSSSKYFTIPYTDRIPAQHGIPTLHEIAFKKLELIVKDTITDLIDNKHDNEDDRQNKFDFIKIIAAHSPHVFPKLVNQNKFLQHATNKNHTQLTQLFIDEGLLDVKLNNRSGKTLLHRAANNNTDKMILLLINAGAYVDQQDFYNWTPLHNAVCNDADKSIRLLIEAGANIHLQDIHGSTPRMIITNPRTRKIFNKGVKIRQHKKFATNFQTLQIFDEAVKTRQLKQQSAVKIQALSRGFIARKKVTKQS